MKIRRLAFLALGALFLVLVIAELIARVSLGLGTPPISQPHPTTEYMFTPEQDVRRFGNRVHINHYGMRSADMRKKVSDERRILVFGDSVLNGGNLTD